VDVNATPASAYVMCECIAKYHAATGKKIGFKPAGGISSAADALCYYSIVSSILGKEWLNKDLFRFGVSRVANNILSAVEQKTVSFF
jgi:deoxyribose-phosphate aldolase